MSTASFSAAYRSFDNERQSTEAGRLNSWGILLYEHIIARSARESTCNEAQQNMIAHKHIRYFETA